MTGPRPADYHADFASIYDELRTDVVSTSTDIDVFLRCVRLRQGAQVLDFGCGTGVHARTLAGRGYTVTGIDTSPGMIEQARTNCHGVAGITLFCGGIAEYKLPQGMEKFDGLLSFANVLNCLPDRGAMAGVLSGLAGVLRTGAQGLIDLWNVEPLLRDGTRDTVRHVRAQGAEFVQTMRSSFDARQQALEIEYRVFVSRDDGKLWRQVTSSHHLKLLRAEEYRELFDRAGFRVLDVLSQRPRSASRAGADDRLACYLVERT